MTTITFLGVGEAFDEKQANTSVLISNKTNLLLDCGYAIPQQIWKYSGNPDLIDAIYISHTHSDHHFGLSPLIMRMWEDGRLKPLTVVCRKEDKEIITKVMHLGHRNVLQRVSFPVGFIEVKDTDEVKLNEYQLAFALTTHVIPNLAIRIKVENKMICYSGDGKITSASNNLFIGSDVLIHDGYLYDKESPGHPKITEVVSMAKSNDIKQLALIHLSRIERQMNLAKFKALLNKEPLKIIFPELNDKIELS